MTVSRKTVGRLALAGAAIAGTAVAAPPAAKQAVTGPVATYWMSAQTLSGMGMGGMGGGKPSMASIMAMASGGGGGATQSLVLQLGSSRKATGEPAAEHLPPATLEAGPSLPLRSPAPVGRPEPQPDQPYDRPDFEKPKGKMLIYWGCGETARPGQPYVIDFAKLGAGQVPAAYTQMMKPIAPPMEPPSAARNTTYGEWPNPRVTRPVEPSGSLIGPHTVKGNYAPQIQFDIGQGQDFLPAVRMTTNDQVASGAYQLGWQPVAGATGYIASTVGGDGDTVVMWTSSDVQTLAFVLPDYLRPSDVSRLLANRTLMSPSQTSCAVPKEVAAAAPSSMYQFVAYGGEANFSYPPRPADPKQAWNIEWTAKVRYRSATGGVLGMADPYGDSRGAESRSSGGKPGKKPKKPGAMDILRGLGAPIPGGL